jgi:hypothetical protein
VGQRGSGCWWCHVLHGGDASRSLPTRRGLRVGPQYPHIRLERRDGR